MKSNLDIGKEFVRFLLDENFSSAYEYLSEKYRATYSLEEFKTDYLETVDFYEGKPKSSEYTQVIDERSIYFSIDGDGYTEAVTISYNEDGQINELEWGRP